MDLVTLAICKKLISKGITALGTVFTLKGTVSRYEDLPSIGNENGDMYLVGPKADGSYDEFYWSSNEQWEAMGSTGIDYGGYITAENLYAGEDDSGTPENPAEGTILAIVNSEFRKYVDDREIYMTTEEVDALFEGAYDESLATKEDIDKLF